MNKKRWLSGPSIRPDPITAGISAALGSTSIIAGLMA